MLLATRFQILLNGLWSGFGKRTNIAEQTWNNLLVFRHQANKDFNHLLLLSIIVQSFNQSFTQNWHRRTQPIHTWHFFLVYRKQTTMTTTMKKRSEEKQTLHAGCRKAESKKFHPAADPLPGDAGWPKSAGDGHYLYLQTEFGEEGSMHAISSYRGNRPTNTPTHKHIHPPTHRPDQLQYTVPQLVHSINMFGYMYIVHAAEAVKTGIVQFWWFCSSNNNNKSKVVQPKAINRCTDKN